MRSKNREINIFNMSLLDILTGALGAFMFMMLSFVPYYNIVMQQQLEEDPNKEKVEKSELDDLKKSKKKNEQLEKEIERLEQEKKELQEKIDELIEKLKNCGKGDVSAEELAKLEEELNKLRKENQELKQRIERLLATIDALEADILQFKKRIAAQMLEIDALKKEIENLKKEIALLKERLAKIREGDPDAAQNLLRANAEIAALKRSVRIAVIIEGDQEFELAVYDPKGVWLNQASYFRLGQKSVRVRGRRSRGFELETMVRGHLQTGPKNMQLITIDGFLMKGTYYVGIRGRGKPPENEPTAEPTKKRSAFQGLFDDFGVPTDKPSPTPSPGPTSFKSSGTFSLFSDSLFNGSLFNGAPWELEPAYAQTAKGFEEQRIGGRQKGKPFPNDFPRVSIRGFAMVNHGLEIFQVSEMPKQEVPIYWWMSIIAKIDVPPAEIFEFRWFPPRRPEGSTEKDIWGMGITREEVEGSLNFDSYFPLKSLASCRASSPCIVDEDDVRGTLEKRDVIPMFELGDEAGRPVPTVSGAKNAQPSRTPVPIETLKAMREAEKARVMPTPGSVSTEQTTSPERQLPNS